MGDLLDLKERHRRLVEKASSPRSIDVGRGAIFVFAKHCKCCGAGMIEPGPYEKKAYLKLYRRGFCSDRCFRIGPRPRGTQKTKHHKVFRNTIHIMELAAWIGARLRRADLDHAEKLAYFANHQFNLLSEKLSWMEKQTGKRFFANTFYRILHRIKKKMGE